MTSLIASNVSCVRGERSLFEDVSFTLASRECLHVVGPNGSGKTSLLRIVCGLAQPETGELSWNGHTTVANSDYLAESAYIAHKDGLKNELTAVENLRIYQQLMGMRDENQLDDCLDRLGILHCADLVAQQLSFGQRRRLAFARLMLGKFSLWILDEPFTGIDQDGHGVIERLCVRHLEAGGCILMTHHQSLASSPLNAFRSELRLSECKNV